MANKVSKSKSAVKAAREAVRASQREVLERAARNADDLAVFYSSQERLDAVDEWLESKTVALREQAEAKRAEHRRAAGAALRALRDRGETVRDIGRLAGITEKSARELIRRAEEAPGAEVREAYAAAEAHEAAAEASIQPAGWGGVDDSTQDAPAGLSQPVPVGS
ncbi:hypothetical protein [Mycobacterium sp. URHB0021]